MKVVEKEDKFKTYAELEDEAISYALPAHMLTLTRLVEHRS